MNSGQPDREAVEDDDRRKSRRYLLDDAQPITATSPNPVR